MPQEFTGWFLWGIIVLVFIVIIVWVLRERFSENLGYFSSLLRFGRG